MELEGQLRLQAHPESEALATFTAELVEQEARRIRLVVLEARRQHKEAMAAQTPLVLVGLEALPRFEGELEVRPVLREGLQELEAQSLFKRVPQAV